MGWFKQLCLSWIILSVAAACVSCQQITSTLRQGNHTCPGEEVIFTCTIRRSSTLPVLLLGWSSAEYIGQGGSLQLSTANMLGDVQTSIGMDGNVTAIATVTNNANINGERILESMLRITAVVASTVTCSGTSGGPASIKFTVSAVPGIPQMIEAAEISRPRNDICVILVQWDPPANSDASDIDQYIIYVPSRNIRNDISLSTLITLTVPNCGDDILIQVAAVNRFGCEGMNSSEVLPAPLDIPPVPTGGGSTPTSNGLSARVVGGIISGVCAVAFAIILLVVLMIFCHVRKVTKQKHKSDKEDFTKNLGYLIESIGGSDSTSRLSTSNPLVPRFARELLELMKKMPPSDIQTFVHELLELMKKLEPSDIQETLMNTVFETKIISARGIQETLQQLEERIPKVMPDFDTLLGEGGSSVTIEQLIKAPKEGDHNLKELLDELKEQVNKASPKTVTKQLQILFQALKDHYAGHARNPVSRVISFRRQGSKMHRAPRGQGSNIPRAKSFSGRGSNMPRAPRGQGSKVSRIKSFSGRGSNDHGLRSDDSADRPLPLTLEPGVVQAAVTVESTDV